MPVRLLIEGYEHLVVYGGLQVSEQQFALVVAIEDWRGALAGRQVQCRVLALEPVDNRVDHFVVDVIH